MEKIKWHKTIIIRRIIIKNKRHKCIDKYKEKLNIYTFLKTAKSKLCPNINLLKII